MLKHYHPTAPAPLQPCFHYKVYGHDAKHCFTSHLGLKQGQSQTSNVNKSQGFGKGQKTKKNGQKWVNHQINSKLIQHRGS